MSNSNDNVIKLSHGSGGKETARIVSSLILSLLREDMMAVEGGIGTDELDDGATIPIGDGRYIVVSIDSYTVNPPFFPGGNLGKLAASGTINDVLMMGGEPIAMMDAVVVEEGSRMEEVREIVRSFIEVLREEGVKLIGGDFKVMPRGQLDRYVITTVGVGIAEKLIVDSNLSPGDKIIVSGTIGEHGAAILAAQENFSVEGELKSDVQPLKRLMLSLIEEFGHAIHAAQDPTRGGLAQTLNEWASKTGHLITVNEAEIPIRDEVRAFTELLGVDPLSLACEGRVVLGVSPADADAILDSIRELGYRDAAIIGDVKKSEKYGGMVVLESVAGGLRILEPPSGTIVPRIC
ncbi:MAG: hydrogenase expression/formation protein HypE [Thermoproteota archaeon]|nr:MAG: hydrogenase expression/formation protein HypE [Candidatus Korarchaeota archaeon]